MKVLLFQILNISKMNSIMLGRTGLRNGMDFTISNRVLEELANLAVGANKVKVY